MTLAPAVAILRLPHRTGSEADMGMILFHAVNSGRPRDWAHFRQEAKVTVPRTTDVEPLSENVWLIKETDLLMSVETLLRLARKHAIPCKTLEFHLESQWQDHPPAFPV